MPSKATERINFGKIKEIIAPPNLIELQTTSYKEFLQLDISASKRKNTGLEAVFTEVFPIESYDGKCVLQYDSYEIGEPKQDWLECLREGITFGAPLYVTFRLKELLSMDHLVHVLLQRSCRPQVVLPTFIF